MCSQENTFMNCEKASPVMLGTSGQCASSIGLNSPESARDPGTQQDMLLLRPFQSFSPGLLSNTSQDHLPTFEQNAIEALTTSAMHITSLDCLGSPEPLKSNYTSITKSNIEFHTQPDIALKEIPIHDSKIIRGLLDTDIMNTKESSDLKGSSSRFDYDYEIDVER